MQNDGISEMTTNNLPDQEKSGKILLTQADMEDFHKGILSKRISEVWEITWTELQEIVKEGNFEIIQG